MAFRPTRRHWLLAAAAIAALLLATWAWGRLRGPSLPGYEVVNWFGTVVPAATPRDIVNRLHTEVVKVLRLPEIRDRLVAQGTEPVGNTTEEFGAFMKSESAKWAKVIKEADIRAE